MAQPVQGFEAVMAMVMTDLFIGPARKLAGLAMVMTGLGWLFIVIGFAYGANEDEDENVYADTAHNDQSEPLSYPFWIVCVSGPALILSGYVHAALLKWNPHIVPFAGAATTFLSAIFLTGLGMIMFFNGELIRIYNEDLKDDISDEFDDQVKPPWWFILEFTGALIAALSWMVVMVLWHFYDQKGPAIV